MERDIMPQFEMEYDRDTSVMYDVRRLMSAIMERAFDDLDNDEFIIRADSMAWFNSRRMKEKHYIFNFENICALLELEPSSIRAKAWARYLGGEETRKEQRLAASGIFSISNELIAASGAVHLISGYQLPLFSNPFCEMPISVSGAL